MLVYVWFLRYGNFFVILDHFLPFYTPSSLKTRKINILKKEKKMTGDIIIFHMCTINDNHMMVPEIWRATDRIFCHFGPFLPFNPPNKPENQNFEKMKWVITRQIAKKKTVSPNWLIFGTSVALHVCMKLAKLFQLFLKKTLWPLFMDGVQLRQS